MRQYAGVCYDGPEEGRSYAWDRPRFHVAIYKPMSMWDYNMDGPVLPENIRQHEYRWQRDLKKWVFVW